MKENNKKNHFLIDWFRCTVVALIMLATPLYLFIAFVMWEFPMPDFRNKEQMVGFRLILIMFLLATASFTDYIRKNNNNEE